MNIIWRTKEDVVNAKSKAEVLSIGLEMWGNCMAGNQPPEDFGTTMVLIGERLGVAPFVKNLELLYEKWQNGELE